MKEIELKEPLTRTEIVAEQEKQKQLSYIGSLKKIKGLTVYELNTATGEVNKAKIESVINLDESVSRKLVTNEGCMYNQALNKRVATKKFIKTLGKTL